MSTNKKRGGSVRNVVYSFLVFIASGIIFTAILAPEVIKNTANKQEINAGNMLAIGIAIIVTVIFCQAPIKLDTSSILERTYLSV